MSSALQQLQSKSVTMGLDDTINVDLSDVELTSGITDISNTDGFSIFESSDLSSYIKGGGFGSRSDLLQSDYYYDRLKEMYPGIEQLGDEFFEQTFIANMLDETVGRRFLYDDIHSQVDQINFWYDNAKVLEDTYGATLGEPLSDDIIANLTEDVLWMEVIEVDGKQVMAPRLYLSQATKDRLAASDTTGGIIADSIILDDTMIENYGLMSADQISGSVDTLTNGGFGQINADEIELTSNGDVVNMGQMSADSLLSLVVENGDLIQDVVVAQDNDGNDVVLSSGSLLSNGDMVLSADSIFNHGSTIDAGAQLVVDVADSFVLTAEVLDASYGVADASQSNYSYGSSQTIQGSSVSVGDDFILNAGGDVLIQGSDLQVADTTVATIGGDFTVLAQQTVSEDHYKKTIEKDYLFKTTKDSTETHTYSVQNHASTVDLGNVAMVDVDGETLIAGSQVTGTDIQLVSDKGVYVVSMHDETVSHRQVTDDDIVKNTVTDTVNYDKTVVSSGINADGVLIITADDGEVAVVGSELSAATGMAVTAADGISFVNDVDVSETETTKTKTGLFDKDNGFFYMQTNESVDYKESVVGSDISSGQDMALNTDGDVTKIGGQLVVAGDAEINAASVEFSAAQATEYQSETETKVAFGGVSYDLDIKRLSAGSSIHNDIKKSESEITVVTVDSGTNEFGGDVSINAEKDVNIVGTHVVALGDVEIDAESVAVVSAEALTETLNRDSELTQTIRAGIGNSWADTAHSVVETVEAAEEAYETMDSSDESKANTAAKAAAAANAGLKAAKLTRDVARSATTSSTMGFYATATQTTTGKVSETTQSSVTNVAGGVHSVQGDVAISADDVTVKGSLITANEGSIDIAADDVRLESSVDTVGGSSSTQMVSVTTELANSSGIIGNGTVSTQTTDSEWSSSTHNNSHLSGDKVTITGSKTTLSGANIEGREVTVEVDELTIESQVDTATYRSDSEGYSVGVTTGFNQSTSTAESGWVNSVSGIEATEAVDIQATDITLTGAYIAQVDESGDVGDGVSIDADTLTATNIEGYDHANSEGYSVGVSLSTADPSGVQATQLQLGYQSSGHEKEQLVKATIGDGDINVDQTVVVTNDSSQTGVNRDMDQLNQITKDEVQESIDVELDIDVSVYNEPDFIGSG